MFSKSLFSILFLFSLQSLVAQGLSWHKTYSSARDVGGYDVTVADDNSIYFVGGFRSSVNFGNGAVISANSYNGGTNSDGYLLKLDKNGNTQWAKAIATDANSGDALHIEHKNGYLYIASQEADSDFDYYTLVEKYDTSGNRLWFKTKQSTSSYWVKDMFVDNTGDVYLLYYRSANHYITKYDNTSGTELFTITIHNSYDYEPEDIAVDGAGYMYVTGFTSPASYNRRLLLEKLEHTSGSSFIRHWEKIYGSNSQEAYGRKMVIDDSSNLYVHGRFNKSFVLDGVTLSTGSTSSSTVYGYVAKFDSSGTAVWATSNGDNTNVGTSSGTGYQAMDIQLSNDGQGLNTVYGSRMSWYDKYTGARTQVGFLPGERYFGLAEDSYGNRYYSGETAYDVAHATKYGCQGVTITTDTIILYGESVNGYTTSGSYSDIYPLPNGCDSTLTLNLTVIGGPGNTPCPDFDTTMSVQLNSVYTFRTTTIPNTPSTNQGATLSFQWAACGSGYPGYMEVFVLVNNSPTTYRSVGYQADATNCSWRNMTATISPAQLDSALTAGNGSIKLGFEGEDACMPGVGCSFLNDPTVRNISINYALSPISLLSSSTSACTGSSVTYTDNSGASNARLWLFPGGVPARSSDSIVSVTYPTAGQYDVALYIDRDCGVDTLSYTNYITVVDAYNTVLNNTICYGDSLLGYYASGTYNDTMQAANGCDSIRTLNLTVTPWPQLTIDTTVCFGGSVEGYTMTGVYTDTFGTNDCDSIRILDLTVLPQNTSNISQTICEGDAFEGYSATGIYNDTLTDASGCDSIRTLDLTVTPLARHTVDTTVCFGQTVESYAITGIYSDTFSTAGCDSIRTLDLTVLPQNIYTLTTSICQSDTLEGYYTTGVYSDTMVGADGCDSIRVLDLTVSPYLRGTVTETICLGDTIEGYFTTGVYADTFITATCDSIRTLDLTVLMPVSSIIDTTICFGETFEGYGSSGTYVDTLFAANGCDSVRAVDLIVLPQITSSVSQTICQGDTLEGYFTTGVYTDVLTADNGCDSTRTLDLTVVPLPNPTIATSGGALSVSDVYDSYQWLRNDTVLFGADAYNYTPTTNGDYTVVVTDGNGCIGSSNTLPITLVGIKQLLTDKQVKAYPNPTYNKLFIQLSGELADMELQFELMDVNGKVLNASIIQGSHNLSMIDQAPGIYFIKIYNSNHYYTKRIVKLR